MTLEFHDPKRAAIIAAATPLFLAHGYSKISMEKIAAAAPVSKATLYNHFSSKDALLEAVIAQFCSSLLQTLNQAVATVDNLETNLYKIATAFVELIFCADALAMYRLVIAESRDFPQLGQLVYDSSAQAVLKCLGDYLRQLNSNGQFSKMEPEFTADAFFSLLKGDRHFQCLLGLKTPPTTVEKQVLVEKTVAFYLRGIGYVVE
jgi:TetR/AcrR family transcriptional repressor of mexJK operon